MTATTISAVGDPGLGEERVRTGITGEEEASFHWSAFPSVIPGLAGADNQPASCAGAFGASPRHGLRILLAGLAATAFAGAGPVSDAIVAFHAAAKGAEASVVASAKALFVLLAVIGGCWDVISLMFDRADIATWAMAFLRRVMWFLTFWVVLIYGPTWAIAIVHSLQNIGGAAAGVASLSPENILKIGSDVSGTLLTGAGEFGFLSGEWAVGFARLFAALATWFSFVTIAIQYTILLVLWFVAGSLGSIFLGFGGSRWTAAYTERFFTLAISIGIKFLTLMFIVGIGITFGPVLLAAAASASGAASPGSAALEIVTISGLFALCAWQVPKIFATVMTGTPAFGASELWAGIRGMVAATMTAAAAVGAVTSGVNAGVNALASAGSNALAGIGGAAGHSGGSADPGTVTSAGSGNVPPPGGGSNGGGHGGPAGGGGGGGSNGSGTVWTGPGSEAWAQAKAAAGAGSSGANIDGSAPAGDAGSGGTDSGDSGGSSSGCSAGAAGGGGSRAASNHAWRQARMRAQRAGYYAQQTLHALSNDGGGHAGGGPPLRIG